MSDDWVIRPDEEPSNRRSLMGTGKDFNGKLYFFTRPGDIKQSEEPESISAGTEILSSMLRGIINASGESEVTLNAFDTGGEDVHSTPCVSNGMQIIFLKPRRYQRRPKNR